MTGAAAMKRALARAARLGITPAELSRRVHGATGDAGMVRLSLSLEERLQAMDRELGDVVEANVAMEAT